MSAVAQLERSQGRLPARGQWTPAIGLAAVVYLAAVGCPGCGHILPVTAGMHAIATDGLIAPRMTCPMIDCPWGVGFVRMIGWELWKGA